MNENIRNLQEQNPAPDIASEIFHPNSIGYTEHLGTWVDPAGNLYSIIYLTSHNLIAIFQINIEPSDNPRPKPIITNRFYHVIREMNLTPINQEGELL